MKFSFLTSLFMTAALSVALTGCNTSKGEDSGSENNNGQGQTGGVTGGSTTGGSTGTTSGTTGATGGGSTGSTSGTTGSTTGGSTGGTTGSTSGTTGATTGGTTGSTSGTTGSTTGGSTGTTSGTTGATTGGTTGSTSGTTGSTTGGSTGGTPCTPNAGVVAPGTISINNGASSTKNDSVNLSLHRDEALQMKITNDADCGCGTWEAYSPSKVFTLTSLNKASTVSVQFKDYDNTISRCASATILHDNIAPELAVTLDTTNSYVAGENTGLGFSIKDSGTGLGSYSCKLNGVASSCALASGTDSGSKAFAAQAKGSYVFEITAADQVGNSVSKSVSWDMIQKYRPVQQTYAVKANNKVDILLVIDNSASMEFEQKNMAQRMSTFVAQLTGLDWRIAVTTTDPSSSNLGDGRLIKMTGLQNTYYVTSSMNQTQAQQVIGNTLQRSEVGSSEEQGIKVTYRAVERAVANGNSANKEFFRSDSAFATVVISDEDESKNEAKNQPQNLLNFVKTTWANKAFVFHSIITKPGDTACLNTDGYSYGHRYAEMSRITGTGSVGGAIVGSVCESDYGSQLSGIANSIQELNKVILLECAPIGNANSSVLIKLNGTNYSGSYEVQGTRMIFDNNLPVGNYELSYQCSL